jgi:phosphotransferase system enzyme I (PtsI)
VDVLETFDGDRVVVRTLDVGGDKPVPYLDVAAGENPFLGVRGVRLAPGERADLFETQLRALLRAAATDAGEGPAVMFPLVATVEELDDLLARVEAVAATLEDEGVPYRVPELGVMVETPASALLAGELAARVDFLSVGTNDLTQYVMAADRGDERVADLHDPRHPPVLRALDRTVRAAHDAGAWVGMCGEMAGDPALTELLVGLGFDELSMRAVTAPAVKDRVAETDTDRAAELAERALAAETLADVEAMLAEGEADDP